MKPTNGLKLVAVLALASVCSLGMGGYAAAQAQTNNRENKPPNANRQQTGNWDSHFATCLLLANDNEIQLAKLAEKKADDKDVKEFAQQMVSDHEKFSKDLERFADPQTLTRRHERWKEIREGRRENGGARPGAVATGPAQDMHFVIAEELADQCLVSAQKELTGKSGEEFDDCYIGIQLGAHMFMIDELKVYARHSSSEFQKVLQNGEETAMKHLERAKKIMKGLKDENDRKTASADSSNKK